MYSPPLRALRQAGLLLAAAAVCAPLARAVTFAPLFTDGAVLQREKPVTVWGAADPGESVTVSFGGQSCSAVADAGGQWAVVLPALAANATGLDLTAAGKKSTAVAHDVVVGDVWLCSGQSNMEMSVAEARNGAQEAAAAHLPLLRLLRVEPQEADAPAADARTTGWKPAEPASVAPFSAIGFFFGRELQPRLEIPIGIIQSTWGGTPIESWSSPLAFAANPELYRQALERRQQDTAAYAAAFPEFEQQMAAWTKAAAAARAKGDRVFLKFWRETPGASRPHGAPHDGWAPCSLFNGMINPLVPYGLRGILWYQGESNTEHPASYHALFPALIEAWRAHFGQGDLPFYWVSLASYWPPGERTDTNYAELREAQAQALALPSTGQALAIDLGEAFDIHPPRKQEVAHRLALLAKHRVYGMTVDDTGPTFVSAAREGAAMRVRFANVSGGLVAHNKPPQPLELAGPDHIFHRASGRIENGTLLVSSPDVREPAAVRYAWHNFPDANLYNGAGLPAAPFRSDNW